MRRALQLSLFGVIHMDDVSKVTDELDGFAEDADALFIEYPPNPGGVRRYLSVFVRAPAFLIGLMTLSLLFQGPFLLLLVRDLVPSEFVASQRVAERHTLPLHAIDEHPLVRAMDASWKRTICNWLLVLPIVALEPLAATVTAITVLFGTLIPVMVRRLGYTTIGPALLVLGIGAFVGIVAAGYLSMLLLVVASIVASVQVNRGIDDRNEVMLDRVEKHATAEGYDHAILVTGKGHLGGMVTDAADRTMQISSVHVSFWRDTGFTYDSPLPNDLPKPGSGNETVRERIATTFREDLPRDARRATGAAIDAAVMVALWFAVSTVLGPGLGEVMESGVELTTLSIWAVVWIGVTFGYHALLEGFVGTTPGKRLVGLSLTSTNGSEITWRQAVMRNLLRPLDISLAYVPSLLTTASTLRAQSVADMLAGTRVRKRHGDGARIDGEQLHHDPTKLPLEQYRQSQDADNESDDSVIDDRWVEDDRPHDNTGRPPRPTDEHHHGSQDGTARADSPKAAQAPATARERRTDRATENRPRTTASDKLPGYPRRIAAAIIDIVAVVLGWFALSVIGLLVVYVVVGQPYERYAGGTMIAIWLVAPTGYYVFFEYIWETTIGKSLMGLAVTAPDGSRPSFRDVVIRNVLRPIDLLFVYFGSGLATLASPRQRSIGDVLGGTVVRRRQTAFPDRGDRDSERNDTSESGPHAVQEPSAERSGSGGTHSERRSETEF